MEGEVLTSPPFQLTEARLVSATTLVRDFHDATVTSPRLSGQEVVCHGDLGPHNVVFRGDTAVAIIDWDGDHHPGRRAVDFAHAVWCFADLTERAQAGRSVGVAVFDALLGWLDAHGQRIAPHLVRGAGSAGAPTQA